MGYALFRHKQFLTSVEGKNVVEFKHTQMMQEHTMCMQAQFEHVTKNDASQHINDVCNIASFFFRT